MQCMKVDLYVLEIDGIDHNIQPSLYIVSFEGQNLNL